MKRRKWKIIVTDPETGENKMISDDQAIKYVCGKVGDGILAVIRKIPALGAIALGARLIYNQGFNKGRKGQTVVDTTYYNLTSEELKKLMDDMKEDFIKNGGEIHEF